MKYSLAGSTQLTWEADRASMIAVNMAEGKVYRLSGDGGELLEALPLELTDTSDPREQYLQQAQAMGLVSAGEVGSQV